MTKKLTILLVDDDAGFLDTIAERCQLKGFDVVTAISGMDAVEKAKTQTFDMAVVDMNMPDMDGLVTITKLKEQQPKIKTLLLTAYGTDKLKETVEALNTGYFQKQEMDTFWGFLKGLSNKLEDTFAAAGMATGADFDDAIEVEKGEGYVKPCKTDEK